MRAGQERLLSEAMPRLEIAPEALASGPLFGFEPYELWLEIGFGSGEHLIEQRKLIRTSGSSAASLFSMASLRRCRASNASGWSTSASARRRPTLLQAAPRGFFSRVFMLYPDPWPKRRHNKRRVVSEPMIDALARTLRPGGELRFATDIDDYAGWSLRRFLASPSFRWKAARADDWRAPWPEWRPTRYEAKARKAGRGSVYLTFVRL